MSSSIERIVLQVELADGDMAWQLAQFIKRISFSTVRELTDAHLPPADRDELAYQMLHGLDAVGRALREKGFAPR